MAAPTTLTMEYLASAAKDVNGFQYCDVYKSPQNQRIKIVHRTQVFIRN